MRKYALVVAGGSGSRMKSQVPKQYLNLHGEPILQITLKKFISQCDEIILVCNPEHEKWWGPILQQLDTENLPPIRIAKGGTTRTASVKNGLKFIEDKKSLVAVHDAVRALVSEDIIQRSFSEAKIHGCAVAAISLKDSIRSIDEDGISTAGNRDHFRLVQTPQTFISSKLLEAYENLREDSFTDDATVFERNGGKIRLIEGSYRNLKITTPEDLIIAEALSAAG